MFICILTLKAWFDFSIDVFSMFVLWVTWTVSLTVWTVLGHLSWTQIQFRAVFMVMLVTVTFLTRARGLFLTSTWLVNALSLFLLVP